MNISINISFSHNFCLVFTVSILTIQIFLLYKINNIDILNELHRLKKVA